MPFPQNPPRGSARSAFAAPLAAVFAAALFSAFILALTLTGAVRADDPGTRDVTVEFIADKLDERLRDAKDLSASISLVQFSPRDRSRSEGTLSLKAVFDQVVRVEWIDPPFLRGMMWILDIERNRFTQYEPTTGEATHHPVEELLPPHLQIPLTPEGLLSLPSSEQFELTVAEVSPDLSEAVVEAYDRTTHKRHRVWVDMNRWLVTRLESLDAQGRVEVIAYASDVRLNQDLSAAALRRLPPGTIERSAR